MKKFLIKFRSGDSDFVDAISYLLIEEKEKYEFYGENHEIIFSVLEKEVISIKDITNDPFYFPIRRNPGVGGY